MKSSEGQRVAKLEARSYSLDDLVTEVRKGKVRLPSFQRRFRWEAPDVERLFESIYRGYPIGTLLFWKRPAQGGTVSLGGVTWDVPEVREALWVLDGQQRLAALALSVRTDLPIADRRFNVFFDPDTEKFSTLHPSANPATHLLPLGQAFDLALVLQWTASVGVESDRRERAFELTKRLRVFQVPAYIVETEHEDAAREIFDRMNTFGKRMKRSEVFDALHSSMGAQQPHNLNWVGEVSREKEFGDIDEQQLLYAVLSVRGPNVLREFRAEFNGLDEASQRKVYEQARTALGLAIDFLRTEADVAHHRIVPYQHLLIALVRFFHLYPHPTPRNRVLLRRWFWRGAVVGPHLKGGTTGTLRQMVGAVVATGESDAVTEMLRWVQPGARQAFTPTRQVRLSMAESRIVLAALFALGPVSPFTGEPVVADDLWGEGREPLPTLYQAGTVSAGVNEIGNRVLVPVSETDQMTVNQAFLVAQQRGGHALLASHLLDDESALAWLQGDVDAAVEARARRIEQYVSDFVESRAEWDLPDRVSISELADDHG